MSLFSTVLVDGAVLCVHVKPMSFIMTVELVARLFPLSFELGYLHVLTGHTNEAIRWLNRQPQAVRMQQFVTRFWHDLGARTQPQVGLSLYMLLAISLPFAFWLGLINEVISCVKLITPLTTINIRSALFQQLLIGWCQLT